MKKVLFLYCLITIVIFSQPAFAISETEISENEMTPAELVSESVSANPKATSNASIGFSTKKITGDMTLPTVPGDTKGKAKPIGRLPSTGETVGIGLSILGVLLIIIFFRKELKTMIENKKRIKGENLK